MYTTTELSSENSGAVKTVYHLTDPVMAIVPAHFDNAENLVAPPAHKPSA